MTKLTKGMANVAVLTAVIGSGTIACTAFQLPKNYDPLPSPQTFSRQERFSYGVNLSHWWAQESAETYSDDWLTKSVTDEELAAIRDMGFRHVRLPVSWTSIGLEHPGDGIDPNRLTLLDNLVQKLNGFGLGVILDLHPEDGEKANITRSPERIAQLKSFWREVIKKTRHISSEWLEYEVLNEPRTESPSGWWQKQGEIVAFMRTLTPDHTIVVNADKYAIVTELIQQRPYDDANIVYNFHFYEPFTFTHQSTPYINDGLKGIYGLAYPTDRDNIDSRHQFVTNQKALDMIDEYGHQTWNRDQIYRRIRPVMDWANHYHVAVSCNEFGVWKYGAPPESRIAWTSDVRSAFERSHVSWTMWEWRGPFGVTDSKRPMRYIEGQLLRALMMPKTKFSEND